MLGLSLKFGIRCGNRASYIVSLNTIVSTKLPRLLLMSAAPPVKNISFCESEDVFKTLINILFQFLVSFFSILKRKNVYKYVTWCSTFQTTLNWVKIKK